MRAAAARWLHPGAGEGRAAAGGRAQRGRRMRWAVVVGNVVGLRGLCEWGNDEVVFV